MDEYKIPVETLRSFCVNNEKGKFDFAKPKPTYSGSSAQQRLEGIYTCTSQGKTLWATDVSIADNYVSDRQAYKAVTYRIKKIDAVAYDRNEQRIASDERGRREEQAASLAYRNKVQAENKKAYETRVKNLSFVTKSTSAGTAICRDPMAALNGSPIKSGEVLWDERSHWYTCK